MCLILLKNLKNHKYNYKMKKFWKLVYVSNGKVVSCYYNHQWKGGWNKADKVVVDGKFVDNSIHVYTKKRAAVYVTHVLPVYVNACDLVGYGKAKEAAFKKVWVKRADIDKILQKEKMRLKSNIKKN